MNTWPNTVGSIVDGISTFDANSLNPIFNALTVRTDYLKSYVENLKGSTGLVFTDTGFSADCKLGTIVSWDSLTKMYTPAVARYSDTIRSDGSVAPAESSYVVGVLISEVDSRGMGTVLANGWTTDTALISTILGDAAAKGPYYLSENTPGTVTRSIGTQANIPVYCLTYTGDQGTLIFNPRSPEYSGHSHHSYSLPAAEWFASTGGGSIYTSTDTVYLDLINTLNKASAVLTKNGIMCPPTHWSIEGSNIVATFTVHPNDLMILHAITPLNGLDPLVHSIQIDEDTSILKLNSSNGNVILSTDFEPKSTNNYTGTAVASILSHGVISCPVVHSIFAGPGISLSRSRDENQNIVNGSFVVSSSAVCENQIDMQITNLDGVYFGSSSNTVSYVFPAGRDSALFGNFRVPHFDSGSFDAVLTLVVRGSSASFNIYCEKISLPTEDREAFATSDYSSTTELSSASTDNYYAVTKNLGTVQSDMLISCKLSQSSPDTATQLISASIKLSPKSVDI